MNRVFKNSIQQQKFLSNGYVIIPGLLDIENIKSLLNVFEKHIDEYTTSFHTSHFSKNIQYKREAHNAISDMVYRKAEPFLEKYKPLFGNFMIKTSDPNTALDIHTDWTYVDENLYTSVAIWSPLVDTIPENGCLGIVEGSHKITNKIRGPLIKESSRDFNDFWSNKYGKLLPMKAGDAIFYHHGLLHFSLPNKTNKTRPAINLTVVPKNADYIHYCMPEGSNEIEMYNVENSQFYLYYNHFQRPESNSLIKSLPVETVKYIDPQMKNYNIKKWWRKIIDSLPS